MKKLIKYFLFFIFKFAFATCSLTSYSNISFGNYNQTSGNSSSNTYTSSCDNYNYLSIGTGFPSDYNISLTNGGSSITATIASTYTSGRNYIMPCTGSSSGQYLLSSGTFCGGISVPSGKNLNIGTYGGYATIKYLWLSSGNYIENQYSFYISLNVIASCSVSTSGINFGTYNFANGNTATATITSTCTNAVPYSLSLGGGNNNISQRAMTAPTGVAGLLYNIYIDYGYSSIFGDGISASLINSTGTGTAQTTTVYGKIPSGQNPSPGNYADAPILTVTY